MKYLIKLITILFTTTILAMAATKPVEKKIVVNITKQEAFAYEDGKLVLKGWISSGKAKFNTPKGRFRVLAKEKFHISNEWPKPTGGAEMPYMLRLTWSGIALHLGYVPNRPASHGCVRLRDKFAQELFKWADVGTRVIIKGTQPKRVSRKHRSPFYMTKYFYKKYNTSYKKEHRYLAKLNRELKKLSKAHHIAMAKKNAKYNKQLLAKKISVKKKRLLAKRKAKLNKKRLANKIRTNKRKITKVAVSRKAKLINYYSKFSYKRLNKILRKSYSKKVYIMSSNMSKRAKIRALKKISRTVKIIKSAKYAKKHKKYNKRKRVATNSFSNKIKRVAFYY